MLSSINANALTISNNTIPLDDNITLSLDTGSDFKLYYDGTNNYADLVAGNLLIRDDSTTRFTFERTTGNFTATGDVTAFSDARLKEDIKVIANELGKINTLSGYTYTRKDTGQKQTGVIVNGADGYWARGHGTYNSEQVLVYAEENQVGDSEKSHADEIFSYVAVTPNTRFYKFKF